MTVVSLAIFFSVLALLWFRVSAGEDPVLGTQASNAQVTTTVTSGDDETGDDDATSSSSSTTAPSTSSSSSIPTTGAS